MRIRPTPSQPAGVAILLSIMLSSMTTPAFAQIAPSIGVRPTPAVSALKPGWVAQVRSYRNHVFGETALSSFVIGVDKTDAFSRIPQSAISDNAAAILFKGQLNVPEAGKYGFLVDIDQIPVPGPGCNYSLSIDGVKIIERNGGGQARLTDDKAIELTASPHPVELQVGCDSRSLSRVRVALKVQTPTGDEAAVPAPDFIVHPVRGTGD